MKLAYAIVVCVAAACAIGAAQPAQPGGADPLAAKADTPATIVQTYSVADLIRTTTDYRPPAAPAKGAAAYGGAPDGGMSGGFGAPGAAPASGGDMTAARVAQLIEELIDPMSWTDNGGPIGQIQATANLLIIRHTPAVHAQIKELIGQLRASASPASVLKIFADWVIVPPEFEFDAKNLAGLENLLKSPYARARTTCFSGQSVYVLSGREETYVRDVTPVVGTNAAGVDPQTDTARSGVVLQVHPQLTPDSDTVLLDLASTVRQVESIEHARPATQPTINFAVGGVDRVKELNQQLQTTLRVKLGQRTVVGGMTLDPSSENSKQLLLLIKVELAE